VTDSYGKAQILVSSSKASFRAVVRAALEMTSSCYVSLEKTKDGILVGLEEKSPTGEELLSRFDQELETATALQKLERKTGALRAAIMARALGPRPVPRQPAIAPAPALSPETEAEIERLLAEIESDDWLAESGEIAKTWEERFGSKKEDG
jgi:His-Xaa-Ser system protein HxsD